MGQCNAATLRALLRLSRGQSHRLADRVEHNELDVATAFEGNPVPGGTLAPKLAPVSTATEAVYGLFLQFVNYWLPSRRWPARCIPDWWPWLGFECSRLLDGKSPRVHRCDHAEKHRHMGCSAQVGKRLSVADGDSPKIDR